MFVLPVIRGCNLGKESGDHLDNVRDRHFTDLILWTGVILKL